MNNDTIGKDFKLFELAKFVSVPVLSRFFISVLCTLDDGLFISRCCGEYSLAGFALLSPYFNGISVFACLFYGTSTYCSIKLGQQKKKEAQSIFSTMIIFSLSLGLILTLLLAIFKTSFLNLIGVTELLMPYADSYLTIALTYIPLLLANEIFSGFFTIAGKANIGGWITVLQTICNFFFDWLFMVQMRTGLAGTAYSNLISNALIFIISLFFFINKKTEFHLEKPTNNLFKTIKESFKFGQTSGFTCLILSLTAYITNQVLLNNSGEEMVASYAIVNTIQNAFIATFSSLFSATSPLISYQYGKNNNEKIHRVVKQIFTLFTMLLIIDILVIVLFKETLLDLYLFSNTNQSVRIMASFGLNIIPFALPFFGINLFGQTIFTAVEKQKTSIKLSLIENCLLANIIILLIPKVIGSNGVWYCFLMREILTLIFTILFFFKYFKKTNRLKQAS